MSEKGGKPVCKYGLQCYQKNPFHLSKYSHPKNNVVTSIRTKTKTDDDNSTNKNNASSSSTDSKRKTRSSISSSSESINTVNSPDSKKLKPSSRSRSSSRNKTNQKDEYNLRCLSNSPIKKSPRNSTSMNNLSSASSAGSLNSPRKLNKIDSTSLSSTTQSGIRKITLSTTITPEKLKDGNESVATSPATSGPSPEQDIDFINDIYDKETRFSQRAEYKEMLQEPDIFIKNKFLVQMPNDFYVFWDFCKSYVKSNEKPECILEKYGLSMVGPFDVLSGKFKDAQMFEPADYLRHWRFFYDPPEFQTIFVKQKTGVHYGYWRDCPKDVDSCFIAKNDVDKDCEINFIADNIFSAVIYYLERDTTLNPFVRTAAASLKKSLELFAKTNKIDLGTFSGKLKTRNRNAVCKTFHRAGLIVPYDRKTQLGYRELIETEVNLKKILNLLKPNKSNKVDVEVVSNVMEKLQPLITAANIAVDECDFGNSIELGIAFFCSGYPELHAVLLRLLVNGYSMVDKPQFIAIIKAHLANRKRGNQLSIL